MSDGRHGIFSESDLYASEGECVLDAVKEMGGNMFRAWFMNEPLAVDVLVVCALQYCSNHSSGCSGTGHCGNASQFDVPSSSSYSTRGGSSMPVSVDSSSLDSSG
jgi:hypothetical protein